MRLHTAKYQEFVGKRSEGVQLTSQHAYPTSSSDASPTGSLVPHRKCPSAR